MDIETLEYFKYIAKYKNITSAAKQLYISQSTLSRHIMALENELGVKLFERNNKQVELTEAGRVFYSESDSFTNHMDSVIKSVQNAGKGHSGVLKITAPSNLYYFLSKPIAVMKERYPGIRLVLESYIFNEIPSAIKYNLYNLGITYEFSTYDHEGIDKLTIGTDDFILIVPSCYGSDHTIETIGPIVRKLPLILPSHAEPPFMKSLISIIQSSSGQRIMDTVYTNTTESCVLNVALDLGYGIIPSSWARLQCSSKMDFTLVDLPCQPTSSDVVLLYKSGMGPVTNNFLNIIKELDPII